MPLKTATVGNSKVLPPAQRAPPPTREEESYKLNPGLVQGRRLRKELAKENEVEVGEPDTIYINIYMYICFILSF